MYADWEIKCNKRKTEPWPESETTTYVQWFEWAEKTILKRKYFIEWHDTLMMYFLHILLYGLYLCSDSDTSGTTVWKWAVLQRWEKSLCWLLKDTGMCWLGCVTLSQKAEHCYWKLNISSSLHVWRLFLCAIMVISIYMLLYMIDISDNVCLMYICRNSQGIPMSQCHQEISRGNA